MAHYKVRGASSADEAAYELENAHKAQVQLADLEEQERLAELYEDAKEFKRLYRQYRDSGHDKLEREARRQYNDVMDEIYELENPEPPREKMDCGCLALLCFPCLLLCQLICFTSTAAVGEYSKKQKQNAKIFGRLQGLKKDIVKEHFHGSQSK